MDETEMEVDSKFQQEIKINRLLPYPQQNDEESIQQLAEIKAQLGKALCLRDLSSGSLWWGSRLTFEYTLLHGLKFSKEDHIQFVKAFYEMIITAEDEHVFSGSAASFLLMILKHRKYLFRGDLELPWRPLYKIMNEAFYSSRLHSLLMYDAEHCRNLYKEVVTLCREFFPLEATQEMLDEWRPFLCPIDSKMQEGIFLLSKFLPTYLPPEHHDKGYKLWFKELFEIWIDDVNFGFEEDMIQLFGRLASDNIGHIDWEPFLPQIFNRLQRGLGLPVGVKIKSRVPHGGSSYPLNSVCKWIIAMMGGGSSTAKLFNKLLSSVRSLFHPSNFGMWVNQLFNFMHLSAFQFHIRVQRERTMKRWTPPIPDSHKLTDEEIADFVRNMMPVAELAMFSKAGSELPARTLKYLVDLRPDIAIPPMLDILYPALETLTEPHRLIACLSVTCACIGNILANHERFPEIRHHILPMLNLCLPGIDSNDLNKSVNTLALISGLVFTVPIVDCSGAVQLRNDLTEEEIQLCMVSAQFEDFVLQYMDRILVLIENTSQENTRGSDVSVQSQYNKEESLIVKQIVNSFNCITLHSSEAIFKSIVQRLFHHVTSNIVEVKVRGRTVNYLVKACVKANPEYTLKVLLPYVIDEVSRRFSSENVKDEEQLDNELLWNLTLISGLVVSAGKPLLLYKDSLVAIIRDTIHLRCKEASEIGHKILAGLLRSLTLLWFGKLLSPMQRQSTSLKEYLPIRDWFRLYHPNDFEVEWHMPSKEEKAFAEQLLRIFLLPELDRIKSHSQGEKTLSRDDLKQSLNIIAHCIEGAAFLLNFWTDSEKLPVEQTESLVPLTKLKASAGHDPEGISIDGKNVRRMVAETMRPLVDYMLAHQEDDTLSLKVICKVYRTLLFNYGCAMNFEKGQISRLNEYLSGKKNMRIYRQGKKFYSPLILKEEITLRHQKRVFMKMSENFTRFHQDLFDDMFRLSYSHYSSIRKTAQQILGDGFCLYPATLDFFHERILSYLKDDPSVEHHQHKASLFFLVRMNPFGNRMKCGIWEYMKLTWSALVQSKHSEKPSILKLLESVQEGVRLQETPFLSLKCSPALIESGRAFWAKGSSVAVNAPTESELKQGETAEVQRIAKAKQDFLRLVETLLNLVEGGSLHWRFHHMALTMISSLIRSDIKLPPGAVEMFTRDLINDSVKIRKICLRSLGSILRQHKRKQVRVEIDPFKLGGTERPADLSTLVPGIRPDNQWMLYDGKSNPYESEEKWNNCVFVEHTYIGYHTWAKKVEVYAPTKDQPPLDRDFESLSESEQHVYKYFTDQKFVDQFIKFKALETQSKLKGRGSVTCRCFIQLFKNYGDVFVPFLRPHIERLVADTSRNTRKPSQQLASDLVSALIIGSKNWGYHKTKALWDWLLPVIKTAFSNISTESADWWISNLSGAFGDRDPKKLAVIIHAFMENPLNGEGGSFVDKCRLQMLVGLISQAEWRVPELLHHAMKYLSEHLAHPYESVRQKIGYFLNRIHKQDTPCVDPSLSSPSLSEFILNLALPRLQLLLDVKNNDISPADPAVADELTADALEGQVLSSTMEQMLLRQAAPEAEPMELEEDEEEEERKTAIRTCRTVMHWLCAGLVESYVNTYSLPSGIHRDAFQLLPILCSLTNHKDADLRAEVMKTLYIMAQCLLTPDKVLDVLKVIKQVSKMSSWHAREFISIYIQFTVFRNYFLFDKPELISEIRELFYALLCDEHVQVRTKAASAFGALLLCKYFPVNQELTDHFTSLSRTRIKKRKFTVTTPSEALVKRHAGVSGLCACVLASPYDVPECLPDILMTLSNHVDDPQPIQMTVKNCLSNFKRTHHDNWSDHKEKFTDDQLCVLTGLLVSPSYYA